MADEFEAMLDARNIPQNMREKLRGLGEHIKQDFVKQDKQPLSPLKNVNKRPFSHLRSKSDLSPKKRPQSYISIRSFKKLAGKDDGALLKKPEVETPAVSMHVAQPSEFIKYFKAVKMPQDFEVGRLHKLRLVLRNERVAWVDSFLKQGGMAMVIQLLYKIIDLEWREEHEDALLHETLLCLKALCTTAAAMRALEKEQVTLFPALLKMLFDKERRGPSEFTTRSIIMQLLFTYLSTHPDKANDVLLQLEDGHVSEQKEKLGFIATMHRRRPYRVWAREISNTTKEIFWIFLHNNVILPVHAAGETYFDRYFPKERPPVPAAPYVGGVEWDATLYLASHLDVMNGCIACLPDKEARNTVRMELRDSGFEKIMGGSLRLCKEKFYGAVHEGLRTWIGAALEDGWICDTVSVGPPPESPQRSPRKKQKEEKPELPKLELEMPRIQNNDFTDWKF